ncbi:MAG: hypothetical protein R3A48_24905 [Polyangiales bacterium]
MRRASQGAPFTPALNTISELSARIAEGLRRLDGAYEDRLNGLMDAGWCAAQLGARLAPHEVPACRETLQRVLAMPRVPGCHPACCKASAVRAAGVEAKVAMLRAWTLGRLTPPLPEEALAHPHPHVRLGAGRALGVRVPREPPAA